MFQRTLLSQQPFDDPHVSHWTKRGIWPARWISHPEAVAPCVVAYKCKFSLENPAQFRLHLTADERYELFLGGEFVGRGSERGDVEHWFFESYDFDLPAGNYLFVARVWSLGDKAPFAQMSLRHGFLLCPENEEIQEKLATGRAPWQAQILGGYGWQSPLCAWGTGWNQEIFGAEFCWNHENGAGENWGEVKIGAIGGRVGSQKDNAGSHQLLPAMLGPMLDQKISGIKVRHVADFDLRPVGEVPIQVAHHLEHERNGWQNLFEDAQKLQIPPYTRRRVLLDLNEYFCARTEIEVSGGAGAKIEVHWIEALFCELEKWSKGHRDEIEGKFFTVLRQGGDGVGDTFWPDGEENREFSTLWWQSGRYVQILVKTGAEALVFERFGFVETRYPLELESQIETSSAPINAIVPLCVRGMQMCSHETYMDCPFYEQLMYAGDTRLEILTTYAMTGDSALPEKALKIFDMSRLLNGLTQSRYPSRVRQIIPPFSLWWVAMVHDFALWRGEREFVRELLPGVRAVCDHFATLIDDQTGLLNPPDGWNFSDWVKTTEEQLKYSGGDPNWRFGVAPKGQTEPSSVLCWHAVLVFKLASELETWFGADETAALQSRRARNLAEATQHTFWNETRGLFADDLAGEHFSEHAQCLAILSGFLNAETRNRVSNNLFCDPDLARTTIYFSHYLFEACRETGRMDKFFERLADWNVLVENGLKTTIEMPEPTRSDCHAWGAHPLFHLVATVAGIRPVAPGFSQVEIKPQLGELDWVRAVLPTPRGEIRVEARRGETPEINLPSGIDLV